MAWTDVTAWTDMAIAPMGPVYFGDGRPQAAGESDFGAGRFPPSPRTMQGVVRTTLLRSVPGLALGPNADGKRIAALVGPPERLPDGWQIAGPWLARWVEDATGNVTVAAPWLPLPRYLVASDRGAGFSLLEAFSRSRDQDSGEPWAWDVASPALAAAIAAGNERYRLGHLAPAALRDLLAGALPDPDDVAWGWPDFVKPEPRAGLRIDPDSGVAEDGMLYTLNYHRFADDAGMVLRFRGTVAAEMDPGALRRGAATLGGKNRLARLLAVDGWDEDFVAALRGDHLPDLPADGEVFWLWTTTPAPVDVPWNPVLAINSVGGAVVSVEGAAVGPAERIGGFALAQGHGAPSRAFVPAGSSWRIRLAGGTPQERARLLRSLHDAYPLGADPGLGAMGFGHTLVSRISQQRI